MLKTHKLVNDAFETKFQGTYNACYALQISAKEELNIVSLSEYEKEVLRIKEEEDIFNTKLKNFICYISVLCNIKEDEITVISKIFGIVIIRIKKSIFDSVIKQTSQDNIDNELESQFKENSFQRIDNVIIFSAIINRLNF